MRFGSVVLGGFAAVALLAWAGSMPADAACKTLSFSVNDYGKDGPIRDAKSLLDKHISEWAKANGIKGYTVGKKDVSCELFLDFIVFDEHTCKASAKVCWAGQDPTGSAKPATASK